MNHIHFESLDSTQDYLMEMQPQPSEKTLVSCEHQLKGRGQYERTWDAVSQGLTFSFNALPAKTISLSSLEMGVLILSFIKKEFDIDLYLKWPNDILNNENQKCGGILIHNSGEQLIVGIGLNLNPFQETYHFKTKPGSIFKTYQQFDNKELTAKVHQYILAHRLNDQEIKNSWNAACAHLNSEVSIIENDKKTKGIFKGIGQYGEALVQTNDELRSIYTGSLLF